MRSWILQFKTSKLSGTEKIKGGRRGGLMVSVLASGVSGPGSGPGREHCVVCALSQDTLLSR